MNGNVCTHKEVNHYSNTCIECGEKVRIKYHDWNGKYCAMVICENTCALANNIINPQCVDGIMRYAVDVIYDKYGSTDGTLLLCEECKNRVVEDAAKHGYQTTVRKVV